MSVKSHTTGDSAGMAGTDSIRMPASFTVFNIVQFFGALNDNVFKLLVILLAVSLLGKESQTQVVTTASALFVLPFLLFSHAAGVLADKYSKRNIMLITRSLDVPVMALGCLGVYLQSVPLLYTVLFLACIQGAVFAPSKYGIIPELVGRERLSKANSLVVGMTYLAIILGTFLPSVFVVYLFKDNYLVLSATCVVFALVAFLLGFLVEKTPAAGSSQRLNVFFLGDMYRTMKFVSKDGYLLLTMLGSAYFMLIAAFVQQNTIIFGQEFLGLEWEASGFLFPVAGLGIAVGSLMAGWLSGRSIEFGIVPLASVGLTFSAMLLGTITLGDGHLAMAWTVALLSLFGFCSGLFIVPLNAFIQEQSPPNRLGEIQACSSFLGFVGVILSAGLLYLLHDRMELSVGQCFVVIGVLTGILAAVSLVVLPDFLFRFVVLVIARCVYRIKVFGAHNVPASGPALLVSNHVTYTDPILLAATQQRRLRFVMSREMYDRIWFLRWFFNLMKVIPISPKDPPRDIIRALGEARKALDDGYLVCIFAEGHVTRNGNMGPFKAGLERIVKGSDYKVIPVFIGGAWGSMFSYYRGRLMSTFPHRPRYPVEILFGTPMAAGSSPGEIRDSVADLSVEWCGMRKHRRRSLAHLFVRKARHNWFRHAAMDTTGKSLTFGRVLTGAVALGAELDKIAGEQEMVGVLLPSSVGGMLVNAALTLTGRVPVNLNFTASPESLASAVRQCNMKTVVSSKAFVEKMEGLSLPEGVVYLEDITPRISSGAKFSALLRALFAPVSSLCSRKVPGPDDLATIIFSSGSTGEPKGVMLSHHNIISNIEAFRTIMHLEPQDRMCGILPFFHSFGFTCTLWCPLVSGFSVAFHPNPLDATKIADLVREQKLTVFLATPTFLLGYIRRAKKEDFASLRLIIVGAEKLKKKIADAFEERFGIRPREGYGATELSPVAALNIPDIEIGNVKQLGTKEGSVGQQLPGISIRVVDADALNPVKHGEQGLLLVKGPNVMLGYLNNPKKTAEALSDGWYNTGDIARVDEDCFIYLLDRLSRYSKIGGEMVPHIAVEDRYMQALGAVTPVVYVTSAPDEKKGEQLVVFHTPDAGDVGKLQQIIAEADVPNLWKPRKENYFTIDAMPTLGSGKIDQKRLKDLALQKVSARQSTPAEPAVSKEGT